jgi:hypothetical protein
MEDVARHHACEQDHNLSHDEQRSRGFDSGSNSGLERYQPLRRARPRYEDSLGIGEFRVRVHFPGRVERNVITSFLRLSATPIA